VHAGDVRDALGEPGAYAGDSADTALVLLAIASRRKRTPLLHAVLPGRDVPLVLGTGIEGRSPARLSTDVATLIRLYANRPLAGTHYELIGAAEQELHIYG
jgi:hypothetical protein